MKKFIDDELDNFDFPTFVKNNEKEIKQEFGDMDKLVQKTQKFIIEGSEKEKLAKTIENVR